MTVAYKAQQQSRKWAYGVLGAYFVILLYRLNMSVWDSGGLKEMRSELLKLDLQHFAEEEQTESEDTETNKVEELKLTKEELDKKIESESDRKLASALEKKRKEWEQELQTKIDEAIKEQERLSKLSEKEKQDEELSKREEQLKQRELELQQKELLADTESDLREKGLPATFASFLVQDDAEQTLENINNFKKAFDEAVNERVKEAVRQKPLQTSRSMKSKEKGFNVAEFARKSRLIK